MMVKDFRAVISNLKRDSRAFDDYVWDFKAQVEDEVFQTLAVCKAKNKKYVAENLLANVDELLSKKIEDLNRFKEDITSELRILVNKTTQETEMEI